MPLLDNIMGILEPFYTRIIIAIIIVVLGLIVGKISGKLVHKLLAEIELDRLIRTTTGIKFRLQNLIGSFVAYFIYFVFTVWALERIGLGSIVLNIVAGGIVILIILALLLSLKDFIPNAVAGLFLHFKGMIKEGDWVKLESVVGKVLQIELVETKIETGNKDIIYVPNSVIVKNKIIKKKKVPKGVQKS